eukprot:gene19261-23024_t
MRSSIACIAIAIGLFVLVSAGTTPAGKKFLDENAKKDGVIVLPSGLQYKVVKSGAADAPSPKVNTPCECHYKGTLIDGTEFDSSYRRGQPATFAPNQVIKELAYGDQQRGQHIKPGSVLIFELEILKVKGK